MTIKVMSSGLPDHKQLHIDVPESNLRALLAIAAQFLRLGQDKLATDEVCLEYEADMRQGLSSLNALLEVVGHESGQCRYIAAFLAGVADGGRYPFDLSDLRCVDSELLQHCINVLQLVHVTQEYLHNVIPDGEAVIDDIVERFGIEDRVAQRARWFLQDGQRESAP